MTTRTLLIAVGLAVAGVSTPVLAQPAWDSGAFWRGAPDSPRERIAFLQSRIDRGAADGSLDRREAKRASRELDSIRRQDARMHYRDGRLDPGERAVLQSRLDDLSRRIRWMRHNGW